MISKVGDGAGEELTPPGPTARPNPRTSPDVLPDLLRRTATGDEDAFAGLYDLTSARVYGLVLRVIRAPELAAEVTQEVYVEAWRTCARFDPERGSVQAWLCTMAHRRAVDRIRQVERERTREQRWSRDNVTREVDDTWLATEISLDGRRVRRELGRLTELQRQAVTLAYYGGCTQTEVSRLLDVPLGTVKTRMRDALGRLRDALGASA